jgi:penicillin amidase
MGRRRATRRIEKAGLIGGAVLLGAAGSAAAALWHRLMRRPLPKVKGTVEVTELHGPVRIRRDRWGVPHIEADVRDDLFFAQGYCHAQERLWQMDF